jgi:hypothetical protein
VRLEAEQLVHTNKMYRHAEKPNFKGSFIIDFLSYFIFILCQICFSTDGSSKPLQKVFKCALIDTHKKAFKYLLVNS